MTQQGVDAPGPQGAAAVVEPAEGADGALERIRTLVRGQQFLLLIALVVLVVFFTIERSAFISQTEISNLLNDWSTVVLLAVGETFVIVSGGIDLSVGSTVTISGVVAAKVMGGMTGTSEPVILIVGLLVCIAIGLLVGAINVLLINVARLVPFVATLATLGAGAGFALVISGGAPVGADSQAIEFTTPKLWVFSWPVLAIIAIVVVSYLYLHYSRFGRFTFAIGSNRFAARAAGIAVKRQIAKIYMLSGLLAGITGMFYFLRLGSGAPTSGSGEELQAIAAVVIGGVSLLGGVGRLGGALIGAAILTVVTDGLVIINVNPNWNQVAVAGLIAAAAALQALRPGRGLTSSD